MRDGRKPHKTPPRFIKIRKRANKIENDWERFESNGSPTTIYESILGKTLFLNLRMAIGQKDGKF